MFEIGRHGSNVPEQTPRKTAERCEPACKNRGAPALEPDGGSRDVGGSRVDGPELFLEDVGLRQTFIEPDEFDQPVLGFFAEIFGPRGQQIPAAFDHASAFVLGTVPFASPHFVDGGIEIGHEVKAVMHDIGTRKLLVEHGPVGSVAVDANGLDGSLLFRGQFGEEAFEALLLLALGHVQQFAGATVEHDRDIAVALAHGLLVDEQDLDPIKQGSRQIGLKDLELVTSDRALAEVEHGGDRGCRANRSPCRHQPHETPGDMAGGMDFRWPLRGEALAIRTPALDRGEGEEDGGPVGQRQVEDGELAFRMLPETGPTFGTTGLATSVGAHLDLHPGFFHQKLLNDTPAELEQRFEIKGSHTPVKAEPAGVSLSNESADLTESQKIYELLCEKVDEACRDKNHLLATEEAKKYGMRIIDKSRFMTLILEGEMDDLEGNRVFLQFRSYDQSKPFVILPDMNRFEVKLTTIAGIHTTTRREFED